jgi:histidine triad (HIT) family protein
MASPFTRILAGQAPAHPLWCDEQAFAMLAARPLQRGHALVVPRREVDHWIDLESDLAHHLLDVAQQVARAIQREFEPKKVGLIVAGLEVRHVHLHLVPIQSLCDLEFARQEDQPDPLRLVEAARSLRSALRGAGHPWVPSEHEAERWATREAAAR